MSALPNPTGPEPKPEKTMSIGEVLKLLTPDFPDITLSKIRYLESEGLVFPQRTSSGYRKYVNADVERLHYVLTTQKKTYMPLKQIKKQLDAMDSCSVIPITKAATAQTIISPEEFRKPAITRLSDVEIAEKAGVELQFVIDLANVGIIGPDQSGFFTADDIQVVSTASALSEFGIDARHLKSVKNAASRQADLISQVVTPLVRSNKDGAREQAEEMSRQMSALVVSLHAILVKNELRNQLG
ncbi:MerR family transcriptional regulator [uncultured Corynebacterium sp.]|jgi:transcriptional regulator, merR family|uniref:transcriptional regulator FtsR n=1 Tax=uncultured Corynebacterium sp. TaxID=159447 RepID=UPI0028D86AA5|nr:MerR family transcriptional regulator [uncultured Corynebacterium sp.]